MRSEFFNQVKRSRQKFYLQMGQIKKEEENPVFDVSESTLESQKSRGFYMPKLRIKIPEIHFANGFKDLRFLCMQAYTISKPYGQAFFLMISGYASAIGKEINRGYSNISGELGKYAEFFQMFIYTNLIDLFEDDPDTKSEKKLKSPDIKNTTGQPDNQKHARKQNEINNDKIMSRRFSRFFGKIIISLELDDLQLIAVKPPMDTFEVDNRVVLNKKSYQKNITSVFLKINNHLAGLLNTINPVKLFRRDYAEINKFL